MWFFSNLVREEGQGFQGLFSKDFISAFNILSIFAYVFISTLCNFLAFLSACSMADHLNP